MYLKKTIKTQLTNDDKTFVIEDLIELKRFFSKNHIKKLTLIGPKPKSLIGQNAIIFIQSNLFRANKLVSGVFDGLNNQNFHTTTLVTRALVETTGALALFEKKYLQYQKGEIDEHNLDEILETLYLGVKDKRLIPEAKDPFNVMKLIDAIDSVMRRREQKIEKQAYRGIYDDLSETSHPNSFGYLYGHKIKNNIINFTGETEPINIREYNIDAFSAIANAYMEIYNDLRKSIEENEDLPFMEYKNKKPQ